MKTATTKSKRFRFVQFCAWLFRGFQQVQNFRELTAHPTYGRNHTRSPKPVDNFCPAVEQRKGQLISCAIISEDWDLRWVNRKPRPTHNPPTRSAGPTAEISFTRMKDGGGESNNLFCGAGVAVAEDWQHHSAI